MKITYEQYLDALTIVREYHQNILLESLQVQANVENNEGTELLNDFLRKHFNSQNVINGIRNKVNYRSETWFDFLVEYEVCTVDYFLTKFLDYLKWSNIIDYGGKYGQVVRKPKLGQLNSIDGISKSRFIELLNVFYNNGYSKQVLAIQNYIGKIFIG